MYNLENSREDSYLTASIVEQIDALIEPGQIKNHLKRRPLHYEHH